MVARLPENVLNKHAHNILTSAKPSAFSWFQQIRDLCIQYKLPHPLSILQNPVRKQTYNKLVKSKVTDYWEQKLRYQATSLTSAPYFKPGYLSLSKPHPMLFACGSNPFECNKAVITARMLSGRYPTDKLQRHWSQNQSGFCLLPECAQSESLGTLEHLLLYCTALKNTRRTLLKLAYEVASESPHLYSTLLNTLANVTRLHNNAIYYQSDTTCWSSHTRQTPVLWAHMVLHSTQRKDETDWPFLLPLVVLKYFFKLTNIQLCNHTMYTPC